MSTTTVETRINARISKPLAEFVAQMVGEKGLYETPSEYIRDLIRRDMERKEADGIKESILRGYRDWSEGAMFVSTGNFEKDMKLLEKKEKKGWK